MKKLILCLGASTLILSACATAPKTPDVQPTTQTQSGKAVGTDKYALGAEQPFVCSSTILAKGKLADRPNLQVMWENYIHKKPEGVWKTIGGAAMVKGGGLTPVRCVYPICSTKRIRRLWAATVKRSVVVITTNIITGSRTWKCI